MSLRTSDRSHWRGDPFSLCPSMPPAGYFLPAAAASTQRTPPKPRFWNPFRGWGAVRAGPLLPRELVCAKLAPCFRIVSASNSATRSALVLASLPGEICASTVQRAGGSPPYEASCRAGPVCPAANDAFMRADVGFGPPHCTSNESTRRGRLPRRPAYAHPLSCVGRGALTPPPNYAPYFL